MTSSAKPVEKVLKSFLAIALAISFCPLMTAEKAQAQETKDVSDGSASGLTADESDPKASDAESNVSTPVIEGDVVDEGSGVISRTNEMNGPIVDWTECGTCQWMIGANAVA